MDNDFREEDFSQKSSENKAENLQEILYKRLDIQEDQNTLRRNEQ